MLPKSALEITGASGVSLKDFAAQNIFSPAGMLHTQYRNDHTALIPNRALAYEPKEKAAGYSLDVSYFEQTGDGAVHTTVEDLMQWDENFYSARIGGKDFITEMEEQAHLNNGKTLQYAKGLAIENYRGLRAISHGGSWGGYRAELLRFPSQHFSVACLCNVGDADPSKRARDVADIFLVSSLQPKVNKAKDKDAEKPKQVAPAGLTPDQAKALVGDYWSDELRVTYRFSQITGGLEVDIIAPDGLTRVHHLALEGVSGAGPDAFTIAGTDQTVRLRRDAAGTLTGFTLDAGRTQGLIFARIDPQTMPVFSK